MGSLFLYKHYRTQLSDSPLVGLTPQDAPLLPWSLFCDASMTSYTVILIIVL